MKRSEVAKTVLGYGIPWVVKYGGLASTTICLYNGNTRVAGISLGVAIAGDLADKLITSLHYRDDIESIHHTAEWANPIIGRPSHHA